MRNSVIGWAGLLFVTLAASGCGSTGKAHDSNAAQVAISVTDAGFEPALVTVAAGHPVTLVVTRKSDQTCATDFVMEDRGIKRALPLNRAVEITFTPEKPGDLRFACAMDMFRGTVRVQ